MALQGFFRPVARVRGRPHHRRPLSSAAAAQQSVGGGEDERGLVAALEDLATALTPQSTVEKLDEHVIGQAAAKRAVAVAMRNRWRRQQLPEELRKEVVPKNILMVGPTGCGKTEIARRMAKISQAPFVKVEATKFTEVGFHGRDVDTIIGDLVEASMTLTRAVEVAKLQTEVAAAVEEVLLTHLVGPDGGSSRASFRDLLRQGALDDRTITVAAAPKDPSPTTTGGAGQQPVPPGTVTAVAVSPADLKDLAQSLENMDDQAYKKAMAKFNELKAKQQGQAGGGAKAGEPRKMTIAEARPLLEEQETERRLESLDVTKAALAAVEESGIVFIDEIDKICSPKGRHGSSADASAEGVQRDLLPLIEGSTVSTKHGDVQTDFVLFIASGAFHSCKPSDLMAELQGRLPIRVTLDALSEDDLYRILTEPKCSLLKQQVELLKTEGVELSWDEDAVREVARCATVANLRLENIGARRLHTLVERIMDTISFDACDLPADERVVVVTKALVQDKVSALLEEKDLSRYIL